MEKSLIGIEKKQQCIEMIVQTIVNRRGFFEVESDLQTTPLKEGGVGMDSLDILEMSFDLEGRYNIVIEDTSTESWKTIGDVAETLTQLT
jgi:acyl carrier protein